MKIKEFLIMRYGPLSNIGQRILLKDFNLFFGRNEEGKTLTIDALIKFLLGKQVKDFKHIDRVEENPEGYVIIEDKTGNEIKLPEKGNLTKIAGLSASECRNIFIIRDSDLSIAPEAEFYTNITDRLTGLKTKEILKIKENLRETGKITPLGTFRDIKDEKLKTRIEEAKELISAIEILVVDIKKERFDEFEAEIVKYREQIESIKSKLESLENRRKGEKYKKGNEALEKLNLTRNKYSLLEDYNEEKKQRWMDLDNTIDTKQKEKENISIELEKKKEELNNLKTELKENNFHIINERKKKIDDEIKPEVISYKIKRGEIVKKGKKTQFVRSMIKIAGVFFVASLIGSVIRPSPEFYSLTGICCLLVIVSVAYNMRFNQELGWLEGMLERINLNLAKFELDAESIENILSNIQKFEEEYTRKHEEIINIENRAKVCQNEIDKLSERTRKADEDVREVNEKIKALKEETKEVSFKEYTEKLKLKEKYEKVLSEQKTILGSVFWEKGETITEKINFWKQEIENLKVYEDKMEEIEYEEKTVVELKGAEKIYSDKMDDLRITMTLFQKSLEEIERKSNNVMQTGADFLFCRTSVDLDAIKEKIEAFVNENENIKSEVLEVIGIFETIESEEKDKVSDFFKGDNAISNYFTKITNKTYEKVLLNQSTGKVEVKHKNGFLLDSEKLSGGAYDQLYFSIRLVLGEKLLKGEKGFFIMDDPFIKADSKRLGIQLKMIKEISESGWQCIYFTAKDEVKEFFKKEIVNNTINYIEV